MSRCNHFTLTKHSISMKSIARLVSDPLQHIVIELWRPLDYGFKVDSLSPTACWNLDLRTFALTDGRGVISTQVRAEESSPSVQCLVLKLISGLQGSPFDPCLVLSRHFTISGVALQSCQTLQAFNANQVHRKACTTYVTTCRH